MAETELASGASAGWLDVSRRIVNIGTIAVPLVVGGILNLVGVYDGSLTLAIMFVLFAALFVLSLVLGGRVTRAMRREMEAGYSTLYDVADFELRHARSLELLRPANVKPDNPGQRSLVANMFRVKPGTVLAKRIDEEKTNDEA